MMLQSAENGSVKSPDALRCPACGSVFRVPWQGVSKSDHVSGFSVRCPIDTCKQHFEFSLYSPPMIVAPVATQPKTAEIAVLDTEDESDWEEALETCQRILSKCDDIPERGEDFSDSIREKVESIHDWIEENCRVTAKQLESLENMESGVDRWLH